MVRIANVHIPDNKKIGYALTNIYGIGLTTSLRICEMAKIDKNTKPIDLSEENIASIRDVIEKHFLVEGDLRRQVIMNINKKKEIKCYQGLRHWAGLPVRGQNTQSNARNRKGKRSLPIAGKKKVAK